MMFTPPESFAGNGQGYKVLWGKVGEYMCVKRFICTNVVNCNKCGPKNPALVMTAILGNIFHIIFTIFRKSFTRNC